ncbi:phosphatase PAP2 family protein [Sphingomonas sp. MMS24-J13]|uniref:phosphatase PAP2 family protein n=1 Tax=Sphingomonas sp. MMS24-J13 TaxID=3238686 RepID=UPI00384E205D
MLPGTWLVGGLGASMVLLAVLMAMVRMRIGPLAIGATAMYATGTAAVILRYLCRGDGARWRNVVRDYSEYAGLFVAVCVMGAMASYPIAAANHGFADARLEAIDQTLRFNWMAWYDVVAAHPMLQILGRTVYQSIFVTPLILFGYFAFAGRRAEARLFIVSFWIAAVLTLALFSLMPAQGPLAFLERGRIPYMPVSALYQAELIPALRDHALRSVDPGSLHGLVCAPSFHAASAILYMAAAWSAKPLRWPLLALNAAMLLATPVEGTHYLIDIISGIVVALVALSGATILARFSHDLARGKAYPDRVSSPNLFDSEAFASARAARTARNRDSQELPTPTPRRARLP